MATTTSLCTVIIKIMPFYRHEEDKGKGKYRRIHTMAVEWGPHVENCQTCK